MKQKVSWDDIHGSQTSTWKWQNLIPGIEKRSREKKDGEQGLVFIDAGNWCDDGVSQEPEQVT